MKIWLDAQRASQFHATDGSGDARAECDDDENYPECNSKECYEERVGECTDECSLRESSEGGSKNAQERQCLVCRGSEQGVANNPLSTALSSGRTVPSFRTTQLKQAESLFMQECSEGKWVVCNPVGPGRIVVLDARGKQLLEQFRVARSLTDVLPSIADISVERIEAAVALFYQMGLLQNPNKRSAPQARTGLRSLTAWLHVTNACNLRCQYCYLEKTEESMGEDIAFQAVDAIFRSARKRNISEVTLKYAGGEASLRMNHVFAIHDYASQRAREYDIKLRGVMLSNGVMLTQRTIEQLKIRKIAVMISLDGIGAYHDNQRPFTHGQASFEYVNRTINRLLANDLVPSISVTVSQRNLEGLPELLEYILQRDLPFSLNYYRDNECAMDRSMLRFNEQNMIDSMHLAFKAIEARLPRRSLLGSLIDKSKLGYFHHHTCGVGRNYIVIDQRGGVAKCHADIKQTVTTVSAEDPLWAIEDDRCGVQNVPVEDKEGCRSCSWRYWCTGGCPLLTYKMTGRYDVKSPNCGIYQALFPEALRIEALRLLKYEMPVVL